MWYATIITALCAGWLCKAVHGDEQQFPLKHAYNSEAECRMVTQQVARLAGVPEPYRIECKEQ
jgi:hypothetical protein